MTKTSLVFQLALFFVVTTLSLAPVSVAWTGEIRGRVVCDVCGDSSIGPEDHFLEGAEVAVLCITKTGEVLNYQAFTNSKGVYTVAETMPESERWDAWPGPSVASMSSATMVGVETWQSSSLIIAPRVIPTLLGLLFISMWMLRCTVCRILCCPNGV